MARQLIICFDGTNNNLSGRRNDTNVTQLCELLSPAGNQQLLYYDAGVGNPGELPGTTFTDNISRRYERLHGLVFGKGIYENIQEGYRFVMQHWQPGDEIFLFGFSRGAFTARSVGGLINQFGVLRPEMDGIVPTLLHIYFADRRDAMRYKAAQKQIRELFGDEGAQKAPIWFVGVWDTVASVGAPLLSRAITASPTIVGKNFKHVRHALALDEHRRSFLPRPYLVEDASRYAADQSIKQLWFSGAHCDVGGGYANAVAGLSRETLLWMVTEAAGKGLRLRADVLDSSGQPDPVRIIDFLDERSAHTGKRDKLVHSEPYDAPLWALGGLVLRNPGAREAVVQSHLKGAPQPEASAPPPEPVESPTVANNALTFPADTVWRESRLRRPLPVKAPPKERSFLDYLNHPLGRVLIATLVGFTGWTFSGALLLGAERITGNNIWWQAANTFAQLPQIWAANWGFAHWQGMWWAQLSWHWPTQVLPAIMHPARALLADFAFIAGYGYLLAFGTSWAFARIAGLRRTTSATSRLVNILGMAATAAVLGDVAENVFTLLLLWIYPNAYFPLFETLLGIGMSLASLVKWAGVAGSLWLMGWGVVAKR